jgi:hypothetical protein
MIVFLVGLCLTALISALIRPQISLFFLMLETEEFDSGNSDQPYELPEQDLLMPSPTRSQLTVSELSSSLGGASVFAGAMTSEL